MKSTEIEAERVVSTSGLLTGRPNASWPQRVSAPPWKANIRIVSFFPPLRVAWKTSHTPCSHISTLDTHPLRFVVFTVHNATLTMHVTPGVTSMQSDGCHWGAVGRDHHRARWTRACVGPAHRDLCKGFRTSFLSPSLSHCLRLNRIIKPISHRTINGQRKAGPFLKKWLFCHCSLDSGLHMTE